MKSDSVNEITSRDIENAITAAGDEFTVSAVVKELSGGRSDVLRRRVERAIVSCGNYFYDEKWHCRSRKDFFSGRSFLVTPDEWEIAQGILFPGHRFVPFVHEGVFPSNVELKSVDGKTVPVKKLIAPLGRSFHYHILLGSEQIFDFMLADDPANESLKEGADRNDFVTLSVFDLADFYKKSDFTFGDALLCTVEDHLGGVVSFRYLSGAERSASAREKWINAMDEAAEIVWKEFQDYLDIPEQLAWICFHAGKNTLECGASLDEFITSSNKVQLRPEGDHAVLTVAGSETDDLSSADLLPEGLSLSANDLDDPLKILAKAGFPLTINEIDGFMLDAIYGRETSFDGVKSRIFGFQELDLKDEAQQAVLLNFLEERFETLLENYNRADDESKADLRSQIMEAVSRKLEYIAALSNLDRDPNEAEHDKLHTLADIDVKLGEALKLINHPGFTPDSKELDNLTELIDDQLSRQEELFAD